MNNKHVLRVRLASIQHYNDELKKLQDATKATTDTKKDLINSLTEFFPFSRGMVIMKKQANERLDVIRIEDDPTALESYSGRIFFRFKGTNLVNGIFRDCDRREIDIEIQEVDSWRILHEPETLSHDTN